MSDTKTQERIAWVLQKQVERLLWSREAKPTDDLETAVTYAILVATNAEGGNLSFTAFRNIITRTIAHLRVIEKHFNSPLFSLMELRAFDVGNYVTLRAGDVFPNSARPNDDILAQVRVCEKFEETDRIGVYVEGLSVMQWLPGYTAAIKSEQV